MTIFGIFAVAIYGVVLAYFNSLHKVQATIVLSSQRFGLLNRVPTLGPLAHQRLNAATLAQKIFVLDHQHNEITVL